MCGDHQCVVELLPPSLGSPPHVRGPHYHMIMRFFRLGITPACAGTTGSGCHLHRVYRDHPRMCGDHQATFTDPRVISGSPPHVRGPHASFLINQDDCGITPACAGTTLMTKNLETPSWDHPRMFGDHLHSMLVLAYEEGSPPHVRGPRHLLHSRRISDGITPACAGTT